MVATLTFGIFWGRSFVFCGRRRAGCWAAHPCLLRAGELLLTSFLKRALVTETFEKLNTTAVGDVYTWQRLSKAIFRNRYSLKKQPGSLEPHGPVAGPFLGPCTSALPPHWVAGQPSGNSHSLAQRASPWLLLRWEEVVWKPWQLHGASEETRRGNGPVATGPGLTPHRPQPSAAVAPGGDSHLASAATPLRCWGLEAPALLPQVTAHPLPTTHVPP